MSELESRRVVRRFSAAVLAEGSSETSEFATGEIVYLEERTGEGSVIARKPEVDEACRAAVVGEIESPEPTEYWVAAAVLEKSTERV